jgi:hypothetical protein
MTAFSSPPVRSNPAHKQQDDNDDQDNADDTNATVTEAVTIAAEAATEAAKGEANEYWVQQEYGSQSLDLRTSADIYRLPGLFAQKKRPQHGG